MKINTELKNEQNELEEHDTEINEFEMQIDEAEKQYVVFQLENQEYGIEIKQVHEIDRLKEIVISPVPKTPDYVQGIINLRGEIVPIVDLRKKMELPVKEVDKKSRILIVKIEKKIVGLLVDGVSEVVDVNENNISLPPDEITDINTKYLTGVARINKKLILLLDIDQILDLEEKNLSEKPV